MRRIVDLTLPIIEGHWRYGYHVTPVKTHANHDPWQNVTYNLESHWFTHIDFPLHFDPEGRLRTIIPSKTGHIPTVWYWICPVRETIRRSPARCWRRQMRNIKTDILTPY